MPELTARNNLVERLDLHKHFSEEDINISSHVLVKTELIEK